MYLDWPKAHQVLAIGLAVAGLTFAGCGSSKDKDEDSKEQDSDAEAATAPEGGSAAVGSSKGAEVDDEKDEEDPADDPEPDEPATECGNDEVEDGETCDGDCTAEDECTSDDACVEAVYRGKVDECTATCEKQDVTLCIDDDGCCPSECAENTDNDCKPVCGNEKLEEGEKCDGNCPTEDACVSTDACVVAALTGSADKCDVVCETSVVATCQSGDGCCPATCDRASDDDCPATENCGNGQVDEGEICDGNCEFMCADVDNNGCTAESLVGNPNTCSSRCATSDITTCVNADGCCAPGCDAMRDNDCEPICGNGVREAGEDCDDGNKEDQDGCTNACVKIDPSILKCQAQGESKMIQNAECQDCSCEQCAVEVLGCVNGGTAIESEACWSLVQCAMKENCDQEDCFCEGGIDLQDIAKATSCLSNPTGPCADEILAATGIAREDLPESVTITTLLAPPPELQKLLSTLQSSDMDSGIGRALNVRQCAQNRCAAQCEL